MSEEPKSIAKQPVLKPAEDFYHLRQEGIGFIEKMGSELWTDYNAHDPGITILEACCYAITELAYRTGWDIKDLLTTRVSDANNPYQNQAFFTARKILTVNPVTTDDFRRFLIDLPEVRNAWIAEAKEEKFIGIYNVLVELEEEVDKDKQDEIKKRVEASVERELHSCRNLCEDYNKIKFVDTENIAVCAEIELRPDTDIDLAQERIFLEIENYFNPPIPFRTLDEQLNNKEKVDEIFNGPKVTSGFLTASDLESASLREDFYTSDIINMLMDIEGVIAVRCLRFIKEKENSEWQLRISSLRKPRLDHKQSHLVFYKNGMPLKAKPNIDKIFQLQSEAERSKKEFSQQDIPVSAGIFRNLDEYFPIQYSLPGSYGVGLEGLSNQASNARQAQAKQLKAYMMSFEKILADSYSQLEHISDLFSLDTNIRQTYFEKNFSEREIRGLNEIFEQTYDQEDGDQEQVVSVNCDCKVLYNEEQNSAATENNVKSSRDSFKEEDRIRRNRFLDHLLARFGERFDDYRILNQGQKENEENLIEDKIAFIKAQKKIGKDRGRSFDYTKSNGHGFECDKDEESNICKVVDSFCKVTAKNIPEIKRRVNLLLGCPNLAFFWKDNGDFELKNEDRNGDFVYLKGKPVGSSVDIIDKSWDIIKFISERNFFILENNSSDFQLCIKEDKEGACVNEFLISKSLKNKNEAESLKEEIARWSIFQRAIIVEHILLRPRPQTSDDKNAPFPKGEDIYSFRLTYVIPGWHGLDNSNVTDRESFITMREFAERIIRQEMPSHLLVNILWVDKKPFSDFECAWCNWLTAQAEEKNIKNVEKYRSAVLSKLCRLKNTYPSATLHDPENNNSENTHPVRLGQTTLGSLPNDMPKRLGEIVLENKGKRPARLGETILDSSNGGALK